MSYLQIDDCFATHGKILVLSHRAFRLHVTALCYCAQNLTDGTIAKSALPIIGAIAGKSKSITDELEAAGVWKPVPDGWMIHDYLDWNPSKQDIAERKRVAKENAEKRWGPAKRNANGIADGTANGNAEPNALLSSPLEAKASNPQAFALHVVETAGVDSHESVEETLIRAVGGGPGNEQKLRRAIAARKPSYEAIARATDAAKAPCHSRVAVALAIIAPRENRKAQ